MPERLSQSSFYKLAPELVKHLTALEQCDTPSALSPQLVHLVRLRASQLNHCGFCQHMHCDEAREAGEQQARLDVLAAWKDVDCFSAQEKAALAWTEALTLVHQSPLSDTIYQHAFNQFGEKGLIALTSFVLQINSWNRISVGFQFQPEITAKMENSI